jgi:hypothetical protein
VAEVRKAIAAHAASADATFDDLLHAKASGAADAARRQAGIASNALESALSHSLLEPRLVTSRHLNAALTIDAALRRIAGRLAVIRFLRAEDATNGGTAVTVPDLEAWRTWIRQSLGLILGDRPDGAEGFRLPPRPPLRAAADDPVADGLTRIARQIEMIAGAMPKLEG